MLKYSFSLKLIKFKIMLILTYAFSLQKEKLHTFPPPLDQFHAQAAQTCIPLHLTFRIK